MKFGIVTADEKTAIHVVESIYPKARKRPELTKNGATWAWMRSTNWPSDSTCGKPRWSTMRSISVRREDSTFSDCHGCSQMCSNDEWTHFVITESPAMWESDRVLSSAVWSTRRGPRISQVTSCA